MGLLHNGTVTQWADPTADDLIHTFGSNPNHSHSLWLESFQLLNCQSTLVRETNLPYSNTWGECGIQGSLCSKHHLFPHKLSVWPPCGTVLNGGVHTEIIVKQWFQSDSSSQKNVIYFISLQFVSLVTSETAPLLILTVSFDINQSLTLLLCFSLWEKYGSYSLGFSCRASTNNSDILIGWSCWVIGSPKPSIHSK